MTRAVHGLALVRALREGDWLSEAATVRDLALLVLVREAPKPMRTVSRLAEALGISRPAVSRCADSLHAHGLVARVVDRDDRRSTFLEATEDGRAKVDALLDLAGRDHTTGPA
jgi:DNA-binding MarR family transcriptional regulator